MDGQQTIEASALKEEYDRDGRPSGDWFCALAGDVELIVGGASGKPDLSALTRANSLMPHRDKQLARAVHLLEDFMRDKGTWSLMAVDFGAKARQLNCDYVFCLGFEADRDPYEYGYTYFDVGFVVAEGIPADAYGRPIKFLVGFY